MPKVTPRNREIILLNHTITTKEIAISFLQSLLVIFSLFATYFAIQMCLRLGNSWGSFALNAILFALSLFAIQKVFDYRSKVLKFQVSLGNLRTVRFKRRHYLSKLIMGYLNAEFETSDGDVTRIKILLETNLLSKFKFDLVKNDIRIEEY